MIVLIALNGAAALLSLISLQIVEDWAAAAALVLLVFHVFVALGLLRHMDWARRAMIGYAGLALVGIGVLIPYSLLEQHGQPRDAVDWLILLVAVAIALFFVWLLHYLRRPDVKQLFP
jgi:drug/metabolite transporter (DMT)-like permease